MSERSSRELNRRRKFRDDDEDRPRKLRSRERARRLRHDEDDERPARGGKRTLMQTIRQLPRFLGLLLGLMRDVRVSRIDRFMVIGAIAYIMSPIDFIPDLIPFLGQVDDVFLLMTAMQRLIDRAGEDVLLDHWSGDPRELSDLNISKVITAASFFLPGTMKKRLRRLAR